MKWIIILLLIAFAALLVFAQTTPEVVITPSDIEIRFSGETDWVNGGDISQEIFSVGPISYSSEPLSTAASHTTKLDQPEKWESEMWGLSGEPFRKGVFIITIHEASDRVYELRVCNRYTDDEIPGPWSVPTEDRVIGKPGKGTHIR